jgi:hypothetical protein
MLGDGIFNIMDVRDLYLANSSLEEGLARYQVHLQ